MVDAIVGKKKKTQWVVLIHGFGTHGFDPTWVLKLYLEDLRRPPRGLWFAENLKVLLRGLLRCGEAMCGLPVMWGGLLWAPVDLSIPHGY